MPWPYNAPTATIANGASLSGAIDLGGQLLCSIALPSGWTTASITFQASHDNATYRNVYSTDGTELTVTTPAADRHIVLDPANFAGVQFVKIRSGTSGASVNQGGSRDLILGLRNST